MAGQSAFLLGLSRLSIPERRRTQSVTPNMTQRRREGGGSGGIGSLLPRLRRVHSATDSASRHHSARDASLSGHDGHKLTWQWRIAGTNDLLAIFQAIFVQIHGEGHAPEAFIPHTPTSHYAGPDI